MKKIIFSIFVLAVLLVGCSGPSTDTTTEPADAVVDVPLAEADDIVPTEDVASDKLDETENVLTDW